jgi:hypothetical protein
VNDDDVERKDLVTSGRGVMLYYKHIINKHNYTFCVAFFTYLVTNMEMLQNFEVECDKLTSTVQIIMEISERNRLPLIVLIV